MSDLFLKLCLYLGVAAFAVGVVHLTRPKWDQSACINGKVMNYRHNYWYDTSVDCVLQEDRR